MDRPEADMASKDRFGWVKNYGVVAVLGAGLIGGFFLWAVNTQVDAQTSDIRADNEVHKVRLDTILDDIKALKANYEALKAGQETLKAEMKAGFESTNKAIVAIIAAIEKANGSKKQAD